MNILICGWNMKVTDSVEQKKLSWYYQEMESEDGTYRGIAMFDALEMSKPQDS